MIERLLVWTAGVQSGRKTGATHWWSRALRLAAVLNAVAWLIAVTSETRGDGYASKQLVLAGVFLGGCAFRSFFPTVYGRRLVLDTGWTSSIFLARCVATAAELAFALQIALLLDLWAARTGVPAVGTAGWCAAALLACAQVFCWYGVATRRYLGELIEESLWTLGGAVVLGSALVVAARQGGRIDGSVAAAIAASSIFLVFMLGRNLPMLVARARAFDSVERPLGFVEGLRDMALRRHLSHRWPDWSDDAAWLTPYFTLGAWVSLGMPFAAP